jgi:hypothetical protein
LYVGIVKRDGFPPEQLIRSKDSACSAPKPLGKNSRQLGRRRRFLLGGFTSGTVFEKHYTPQELADLWQLDESTIRRMFIDEPGVLVYGKEHRRDGRRDYVTLRIPASVAESVYRRRIRR